MQDNLNGPLDQAELGRLKGFLNNAAKAGVEVIIDLHNYGRYEGSPIGSTAVTSAHFADFWKKLAGELKDHPALKGYDIMNEPHDKGGATRWPTAAQAAVNAIRQVDSKHAIYVEGEGWAGAHTWPTSNPHLNIKDPANNFYYEAHQYFDRNNSGTYSAGGYDKEGAYANIGVDRLKPFVDWLDARGAKGFIGEFAVPDNDPRWLTVLDRFMAAMEQHDLDGTYWGAGSWWGNYPMALIGADGKPNPQLAVLLKYVDDAEGGAGAPVVSPPTPEAAPTGTITGTAGADLLSGTSAADTINGLGGRDVLDGKAGADRMAGGADGDTYIVENSGDRIVELVGQGNDLVNAYISHALAGEVENLSLRGGAALTGTGNGLNNRIEGNDATNLLNGGSGDDILVGRGGADRLTGGAGKDMFDFNQLSDSRGGAVDQILDFVKGQDRIDLSTLDAKPSVSGNQAFSFVGVTGFSGRAGELRYAHEAGKTMLHGDVSGDGVADFSVAILATTTLQPTDFVL